MEDASQVNHQAIQFNIRGKSVRDLMVAISGARINAVVLVNEDGKVEGIATDGDVRRGLLSGMQLTDAAEGLVDRYFVSVDEETSRATALDIMNIKGISHVPIVDFAGRFVGIHTNRSTSIAVERPNPILILAGGRGRRLAPMTDTLPKPMLPIAGMPILERLIHHLVGHGLTSLYISVGYRAEAIVSHFGNGEQFGCSINYLKEQPDVPLGTAGPLRLLRDILDEQDHPILIVNGDLVTDFDAEALIAAHNSREADLSVGVTRHRTEIPFGVAEVDDSGWLTSVIEKPELVHLVNAGIYVLSARALRDLRVEGFLQMTDVIDQVLASGSVASWEIEERWQDIGRADDYRRARGF